MSAQCSKRSAASFDTIGAMAKRYGPMSHALRPTYLYGQFSTHWQGIYPLKKCCWRSPGGLSKIINKTGNEQPFGFFLLVPLRCQLRRSTANLDYPVFTNTVLKLRCELVAIISRADLTI
ncbi:hypothetical protein SAMN05216299_1209 [Nitrosospira sp. Nsp14]|nr:hypothetical protein SAMN05216299_1209 [Nitrosospira sp. Nsp14]